MKVNLNLVIDVDEGNKDTLIKEVIFKSMEVLGNNFCCLDEAYVDNVKYFDIYKGYTKKGETK